MVKQQNINHNNFETDLAPAASAYNFIGHIYQQ